MAKSRVPSPKEVVAVRRLPAVGSKLALTVEVARVNKGDTVDTVTLRVPGFTTPITINADYLPVKQ